jgi:hypothetical protein
MAAVAADALACDGHAPRGLASAITRDIAYPDDSGNEHSLGCGPVCYGRMCDAERRARRDGRDKPSVGWHFLSDAHPL